MTLAQELEIRRQQSGIWVSNLFLCASQESWDKGIEEVDSPGNRTSPPGCCAYLMREQLVMMPGLVGYPADAPKSEYPTLSRARTCMKFMMLESDEGLESRFQMQG